MGIVSWLGCSEHSIPGAEDSEGKYEAQKKRDADGHQTAA